MANISTDLIRLILIACVVIFGALVLLQIVGALRRRRGRDSAFRAWSDSNFADGIDSLRSPHDRS